MSMITSSCAVGGVLVIDGVDLSTGPAYITPSLFQLWGGNFETRGTDRLVPGRVGVIPYRRRPTVTRHSLRLLISGHDAWDGGSFFSYSTSGARPGAPTVQEDEVPLTSPGGAALTDFRGPAPGSAIYADGWVYDGYGWRDPTGQAVTTAGDPIESSVALILELNIFHLHSQLVVSPGTPTGTRSATLTLPSGAMRSGQVHVLRLVTGPTALAGWLQATLDVSVPSGFLP